LENPRRQERETVWKENCKQGDTSRGKKKKRRAFRSSTTAVCSIGNNELERKCKRQVPRKIKGPLNTKRTSVGARGTRKAGGARSTS